MTTSYKALGKYAILPRTVSTRPVKHHDSGNEVEDLIAHFARSNPATVPTEGKPSIENPATDMEKLVGLTERSHENLFVAKTVFPFVLFADSLKIDRQKLTIVHNSSFRTAQTVSTEIKNIINIQTDLRPLFGSITVTSKHFLNNTQTIQFLRRRDIVAARCLLQGFMIAHRANIDTSTIEKQQLLTLLSDLGQENRW